MPLKLSVADRLDAPRWRVPAHVRRHAAGLLLVLFLHALLGLLLLSLAPASVRMKAADAMLMQIFNAPSPAVTAEPEPQQEPPAKPAPEPTPEPTPEPPSAQAPALPAAAPDPPPIEPLPTPEDSRALAQPPAPPPAAPARVYGPPDVRPKAQPDSDRVEGSGPNGEPLYAAQWYREPYDDELRGYLSTAQGPGWGLIACRTIADYRVADCVIVAEYPTGSNIARSVHAAAWQFRVRPPRIGGRDQVGEWVRIRIDYERRRSPLR